MKSLYGSMTSSAVISLSNFRCSMFGPPMRSPKAKVIHAVLAGRAAADDDRVLVVSLRQLLAGLLRRRVRGVPVWPVLVALPPGTLLVLAVCSLRTPQCARQLVHRREGRRGRFDATREPRGVLLQRPPVPRVKLLCAVDVRDGDDDDLELHVDARDAGVVTTDFILQICHLSSSYSFI